MTVQDLFEAVGKHSVGEMSDDDLDELEQVACPSAGACGAQFTANTMATVSEAIGLALPYSAGAPAPYEIRDRFCMAAGEKVMELHRRNIRPRDIVTLKALENAATVVAASGGSTNAALHLPAIAHECGIKFDNVLVLDARLGLRGGAEVERPGRPQRAPARHDRRLPELRRIGALVLRGLGQEQGRGLAQEQRLEVRLRHVLPEGQDDR